MVLWKPSTPLLVLVTPWPRPLYTFHASSGNPLTFLLSSRRTFPARLATCGFQRLASKHGASPVGNGWHVASTVGNAASPVASTVDFEGLRISGLIFRKFLLSHFKPLANLVGRQKC